MFDSEVNFGDLKTLSVFDLDILWIVCPQKRRISHHSLGKVSRLATDECITLSRTANFGPHRAVLQACSQDYAAGYGLVGRFQGPRYGYRIHCGTRYPRIEDVCSPQSKPWSRMLNWDNIFRVLTLKIAVIVSFKPFDNVTVVME